MKEQVKKVFPLIITIVVLCNLVLGQERRGRGFGNMENSTETIKVTIEQPENGSVTVSPKIPDDGIVEEGTVITLKARTLSVLWL